MTVPYTAAVLVPRQNKDVDWLSVHHGIFSTVSVDMVAWWIVFLLFWPLLLTFFVCKR